MERLRPNRREVLLALGAAACAPERAYDPVRASDPSSDWEGLGDPDVAAFPLAVQSGDPRPDGLLLWTRYEGTAALEVVVMGWTGAAWAERGVFSAMPVDGYVHVALDALPADLPLAYQFRDAAGALSAVGRARTAMDSEAIAVVRFGATSCCSMGGAPFPNLTQNVARGPLDFFVWVGDTIYADGAITLDEYRAEWAAVQATSGMQDMMRAAPALYTWDDHEVDDNWNVSGATDDQLAAARQALHEHTPVPRIEGAPNRLWRSYRFGRTVEVFVLDCRGERDLETMSYVSEEQMAWLLEGLSASECTWKVLINSVPIANFPEAYDIRDLDMDRWEGFPAQRSRLLDHIADEDISGVLFVSGDLHHGSIGRVEAEGPASRIFDVLVGPTGSQLNIAGIYLAGLGDQWVWSDADRTSSRFELYADGVARITFVRDSGETLCEAVIDTRGNVLDLHSLLLDHT